MINDIILGIKTNIIAIRLKTISNLNKSVEKKLD
jgi:hypothetical protein